MLSRSQVTLHGVPVLVCAPDGPKLRDYATALDLIGEAMGCGAEAVVVPVERVAEEFFTLRGGLAGQIVQKFADYRLRLVLIGDVTRHTEGSAALRAFVHEANLGEQLWFLATPDELEERLRARRPATAPMRR